ncbi:MAG TPA: hypothetical protein VJP02_07095 [Candidatus Sulfotelmatobacter sp.]|nr:hypothetical protein [Candidatus Sulfotelmatobacter sp.]
MKTIYWAVAVTLLLATAMASATDPFVGRWVLNARLSKYPSGTCPRRMMIEMESAGDGVHYRSDATYANGVTAHSEYTADYNGKQSLVMGNRGLLLPVSLRRSNSRLVLASYTKGLQVVATSRRTVSKDGQRMTITTISKDKTGADVISVGVYEKQRERK